MQRFSQNIKFGEKAIFYFKMKFSPKRHIKLDENHRIMIWVLQDFTLIINLGQKIPFTDISMEQLDLFTIYVTLRFMKVAMTLRGQSKTSLIWLTAVSLGLLNVPNICLLHNVWVGNCKIVVVGTV